MKNLSTWWKVLPKRLKFNLTTWLVYSIPTYILLLPLWLFSANFLLVNISISIILGFLFGFLNSISIELRKLNGEKFPNLEETDEIIIKKDELIKS
jgi:preprotein translocase subunit SecF